METIIELGGKKYKVTPVEEGIDAILLNNAYSFDMSGKVTKPNRFGPFPGHYPTAEIAEKVMLYGLLHSVAHKLNENAMLSGNCFIVSRALAGNLIAVKYDGIFTISPAFKTKELAEQAIRIFENSRFDLKKLFQ